MSNTESTIDELLQKEVSSFINEKDIMNEDNLNEEIPVPKIEYSDGYVPYNKVFGKPPSGINHAIKVFKKTDWPESVRKFIPPEPDKSYLPNKENMEKLVVGIMQHDKILIHGKTGSGKSSLVQYVCGKLNIPFVRVNFSGDMESAALFGEHTVTFDEKGNSTVIFKEGPLTELARAGGVLCCDEFSTAPPEVAMAMQWPLEDDGKVYLKDMAGSSEDKLIDPHEWFTIVATDNTELQGDTSGRHAGTTVQNTALLDRFQVTIKQDYLTAAQERSIMAKVAPSIPKEILKKMTSMSSLIRDAYDKDNINLTMSQRTLNNWAKRCQYWSDPILSFKDAFYNKLTDDDKAVVKEFVFKVFGQNIK